MEQALPRAPHRPLRARPAAGLVALLAGFHPVLGQVQSVFNRRPRAALAATGRAPPASRAPSVARPPRRTPLVAIMVLPIPRAELAVVRPASRVAVQPAARGPAHRSDRAARRWWTAPDRCSGPAVKRPTTHPRYRGAQRRDSAGKSQGIPALKAPAAAAAAPTRIARGGISMRRATSVFRGAVSIHPRPPTRRNRNRSSRKCGAWAFCQSKLEPYPTG
jgi:hypothetical protein